MQQRPRAPQQLAPTFGPDRTDEAHPLAIEVRFHRALEVVPILHDARDDER